MQKYYLLIFNEDYADEHNVPACACLTENQYNKWRESPTGVKNPKYEATKADYDRIIAEYREYMNGIQKLNLNNKYPKDYTPEEIKWLKDNEKSYPHRAPSKMFSGLRAFLGNSGECFEESYTKYEFCKDLVDAKIVKVHEVNKEFFGVFNEVRLYDLSLCNVFNEDSLLKNAESDFQYESTRSQY